MTKLKVQISLFLTLGFWDFGIHLAFLPCGVCFFMPLNSAKLWSIKAYVTVQAITPQSEDFDIWI